MMKTLTQDMINKMRAASHLIHDPGGEVVRDLLDVIESQEKTLQLACAQLKQIIITEGQDAGVVLLSSHSPTHYDQKKKCIVYEHEYFSPLGDALVGLWKILNGEDQCQSDSS